MDAADALAAVQPPHLLFLAGAGREQRRKLFITNPSRSERLAFKVSGRGRGAQGGSGWAGRPFCLFRRRTLSPPARTGPPRNASKLTHSAAVGGRPPVGRAQERANHT